MMTFLSNITSHGFVSHAPHHVLFSL